MINRTGVLVAITIAAAFALPLFVGCSKQPAEHAEHMEAANEEHAGHAAGAEHAADEHAAMGHADAKHEHEHGGEALTEESVKIPDSFGAGVARLDELQKQIGQLIENNELANVHRVAEEMAIVARKMKELAVHDIAEDNRAEAGRLCNQIAGYFSPIDEAADAGKKDETMAIHMQMASTISKLEALSTR